MAGRRRGLEGIEERDLTPGFVGRIGAGPGHGTIDLVEHGGPVGPDGIAGARLDQRLERLAIDGLGVHPTAEVLEVRERPPVGAGREQRLHGRLAHALDGRQTEADHPPIFGGRGRSEVQTGGVDIGTQGLDAQGLGLRDVLAELGRVALIVGHHGAEELHRVVRLEPGRLIGHDRVGRRMRLVEAVAREFLEQVEDFVGLGGRDAIGVGAALHEGLALLDHLLELLLAHGAAQQIGATEGVPGQDLRRLHDLLLVDEDAVGLAGDGLQQGMRIDDLLFAMPALDEVRDQVHGTRPVERNKGRDVLDRGDLELLAQVAHAPGFQLEHAEGLGVVEQVVGLGVVEREVVEIELHPGGLVDHLGRVADDRQGLETQEVHLQQAEVADRAHGVLGDDPALVVLLERQQVHQRLGPDDHAGRVHAHAAGLVFQQQSRVDEFAGDFLFVVGLLELGVLLERVLQAPLHVGDHLGQPIGLGDRQPHDPSHVADDRLRPHGPEGDDLGDGISAVLVPHIPDHLGPTVVGEVDVDIGRADALGIEEALEEQPVAQRINVRDLQQVGHHRAGGRSARHAGDAVVASPAHEVADDQEVRHIAGFLDDPEFEIEPVENLADGRIDLRRIDGGRGGGGGGNRRRFRRNRRDGGIGGAGFRLGGRGRGGRFLREEEGQPLGLGHGLHHDGRSLDMGLDRVSEAESVAEQLAQVALAGPRLRRLEHRIVLSTLAVANLQVALLGHLHGVEHRVGHLGEEVLHLLG